jgi:hypothetical protein
MKIKRYFGEIFRKRCYKSAKLQKRYFTKVSGEYIWRHDTQHNNTQHNNTQPNHTQHNDIQHNHTQYNDIQHYNKKIQHSA